MTAEDKQTAAKVPMGLSPGGDKTEERMSISSEQLIKVICERKVLRNYSSEPISEAMESALLHSMVSAPSASNKQAWAFLVVRDKEKIELIRALAPGILGLPRLLVVACIDVRRAGNNEPTTEKIFETSKLCVAMAVENLLLAAHFLGLGGCPVASFRPLAVQRVLHLPNDIKPLLLVPIGHPMVPPEPSVRRDISEVVRYETWEAA